MNLVWFLTIGAVISTISGELGRYPFGSPGAVGVTDLMVGLTLMFLLVWQVGIQKKISLFRGWRFMIIFWLVALASLIFSKDLGGVLYLIRFILYSSYIWVGFNLVKSKVTNLENIYGLIILTSTVLALLGFLQLLIFPDLSFLTDFGFDPHKNRLTATFLDPNFMGAYLSIGALITLERFIKTKSKILLAALIAMIVATILTFSRSAYLMLASEFLVYGLFRLKKLVVILLVGVVVLYLVFPGFSARIQGGLNVDRSASERIISWQNGLQIFRDNPLLGVGFNNLRFYSEKKNLFRVFSDNGGHSGAGVDSSLLFVLVTTGIVGLVTFLAWWIYMFKVTLPKKEPLLIMSCISLGLLIDSQFINSLFYPPIMLLVYLLWGSIL